MDPRKALTAILWIGVAGMLFSGYLSWSELARDTCPLGGCTYLLGFPSCVYGFIMYAVVTLLAYLGLSSATSRGR